MNSDRQAFLLEMMSREFVDPQSCEFGSSVSRLLELHLEELDEWRYCWTDGLLDTRVQFHNGSAEILAFVIVVKNDGFFWMDPLQALFSINRRGKITHYELRFGDQDEPSEPYRLHRKYEPSRHHKWLYRFTPHND